MNLSKQTQELLLSTLNTVGDLIGDTAFELDASISDAFHNGRYSAFETIKSFYGSDDSLILKSNP